MVIEVSQRTKDILARVGYKKGETAADILARITPETPIATLTPYAEDILARVGYKEGETAADVLARQKADLTSSLQHLYPEMFDPAVTQGISQEELPQRILESIGSYATENPDSFIDEIRARGRNKDTETLLRALQVPDQDIENIFTQATSWETPQLGVLPLFQKALPLLVTERNAEVMVDYFFANPETLRRNLISVGRNEDTESLIRGLFPDITQSQLEGYFSLDALVVEKKAEEVATTGKYGTFTAGVGDLVANIGGIFRWLGAEGIGDKISRAGQFMQVQAKPDDLGEFNWNMLFNPEFYMIRGVRTLPSLMLLAVPGIGAYGLAGSVAVKVGLGGFGRAILTGIGGAALSRPLESAMEAAGAYDQARSSGLSDAKAKDVANQVFKNNMTLVGLDAVQIAAAFMPTPGRVFTNLITRGLVKTAMIGGKLVFSGLTEGGEEYYQEIIQRQALGLEVKMDAEMQQVFAIGALMGIGMGGGASILMSIESGVVSKLNPEQKATFDSDNASFVKQGVSDEVATKLALDKLAETEEGARIIEDVAKAVEQVTAAQQIKTETVADRIAKENLINKIVEQSGIKPEEIGLTAEGKAIPPEVAVTVPITPAKVTPAPEVTKPKIPEARVRELKNHEAIVLQAIKDKPNITFPELEQVTKLQPVQIDGAIRRLGEGVIIKTEGRMTPGGLKPSSYTLTPKGLAIPKAEALFPGHDFSSYTQKGTPQYNHVPRDVALEDLTKRFNMTPDEIADRVMAIRQEKARIRELERPVTAEELGITEEEIPTEEVPPIPPPQSVTPPPIPVEPQPTGGEITRIITQSTEQVRQDKVGAVTKFFRKIPGIRQILEFEQPGIKMTGETEKVLTAMVAENAARSDVSVWATGTRLNLLKQIRQAFGKDSLKGEKIDVKFIGTAEQAKNPITGTLKDIADNPELYELSNEQQGVLAFMEGRNDQLLDYVVSGYNAEIGRFQAKEGGAFLPNVDVSEDVVEYLGNEMRAVSIGRGKTRIWQTARERMAGKTPFKPELDIQKLLEGLDNFKASAAGGQTYRVVIGGLTRLEVMEQTHPDLYNKMIGLRKQLRSLQASGKRLGLKLETAVDKFLASPVEDIDLANVREDLDIEITRGKRAGMDVEAIRDEIDNVKAQISELKPAWEAANLKPYVFIQEGVFRYFPAEQTKLIRESRLVSRNPALNFIERWRGQAFSGDFSPFAIQGVIGVLADPWGSLKSAMGGIRTAIQTHDWNHSISIEGLADDIANNPNEWSQFASLMGRGLTGTPREYSAGFLSKIPGFDKFTETTYLTVTRGSFNLWQRTYKNMIKSGIPELEAKVAAANIASQVYPLASAVRLGQSPARAAFLRAMPTSYSFIRQPASLLAEATNGLGKIMLRQKLTPAESLAVKVVITGAASTLAVSATSAAISAAAKGGDDDDIKRAIWDAINPDPHNGKFSSIIIGNIRIPIGGPFRAIFRAVYPQDVKGSPIPLPFWGLGMYIRNRITPAVSTQLDLVLNKDWSGNQIIKGDFPENILRFLAYEFEGFLPLTAGAGVEAIRQGEKYKENVFQQMIGQFMGVNPVTLDNTYLDRMIRQLGLSDPDAEVKPYSIQKPDLYNTKDLYSDARWTKDLTIKEMEQQGFDQKIISIAETRDIKDIVDAIPNKPLTDITVEEILDRKYPEITQAEYVLLMQYHALETEAERKQFIKDHPEIGINKRNEWLISHPKENAQLAIWGQASIRTKEAYTQFLGLLKTLDIPDSALPEMSMPPEGSIDNYFRYQDMVANDQNSSWEAQLMMAKDTALRDFLGLKPTDTPIASLELKVKNRANFDTLDSYSDENSPDYIADDKARVVAVAKFKADNPEFVDDTRRIEAIEKGTDEAPIDDALVTAHVGYGRLLDQEGVGSSSAEVMLYRVDNPDYNTWRMDTNIWGDQALKPIDETRIPIWRIDVKYVNEDTEYDALPSTGTVRADYLAKNPDYRIARRQRNFYNLNTPLVTNLVLRDKYVGFYESSDKGYVKDHYLLDNPDLEAILTDPAIMGNNVRDKVDPTKVPDKRYDEIYTQFQALFDQWDSYGLGTSPNYIPDPDDRAKARDTLIARNPDFKRARWEQDAYLLFIGQEKFVPDYLGYKDITSKGKPAGQDYWFEDDWFLLDHPDFYKAMVDKGQWQERDFSRVPPKDVYDEYLVYDAIIGSADMSQRAARFQFRRTHPRLDAWLVLIKAVSQTMEEYDLEAKLTTAEIFARNMVAKRAEIDRLKAEIDRKLRALK